MLSEGALISAQVKIISTTTTPGKLSKKKLPLSNITLIAQDIASKKTIDLKWFNARPSMTKSLQGAEHLNILGTISTFNGKPQIINPSISKSVIKKVSMSNTPLLTPCPAKNKAINK